MTPAPTPARRYPVWSLPTITAVTMISLALTAASVYLFGHHSLLAETDRLLATVAAALFLFLSVGLYRGARIRKSDLPRTRFVGTPITPWIPDSATFDPSDLATLPIDVGGEGCLGALLSGILSVVLAILLILALWLLVNIGAITVVVLFVALGYVFHRALRQVFRHARTCKGRLRPTLTYALLYTTLYTGWLFALAHITHHLLRHHPPA